MDAVLRRKKISTAMALLPMLPFVPAEVREGVAALAEEVAALGDRVAFLEGDVRGLIPAPIPAPTCGNCRCCEGCEHAAP